MGKEGFQEYLEAKPGIEDATAGVPDAVGWRMYSSTSQ